MVSSGNGGWDKGQEKINFKKWLKLKAVLPGQGKKGGDPFVACDLCMKGSARYLE